MKTNKQTISLLVYNLTQGKRKALKQIYEAYNKEVYAFVFSLSRNKETSEDIVQETFIKIWNNRDKIKVQLEFKSYLLKIAYNLFIDGKRKANKERSLLDNLRYEIILRSFEDKSDNIEQIKKIQKAIGNLPPRCREIFKLSKYHGMKYKEIAKKLDISVKTVEVQMYRAYKSIREDIKK